MSSSENNAPFHVLMASKGPSQEMLLRDRRLRNDYLARRFRCLSDGETEKDLWSAASPVERALVDCCELGVDNEQEYIISGCLTKGKEGPFVRLMALYCDSAATRALALAILQRTMEQDELEVDDEQEESKGESEDDDEGDEDDDDEYGEQPIKTEEEEDTGSEHVSMKKSETASDSIVKKEDDDDDVQKDKGVDRMSGFLAAGGLTILNQWLLDAMTPNKTVVTKDPQSTAGSKPVKETTRLIQKVASPTGPLLLPLLSVLKDMPFDKNLVKSSKINKQIRNLKKQLDEATTSRKKGRDPAAGGLDVAQVQTAVEELMKVWEERNKTSSVEISDPFTSLRDKMAERLTVLKRFESGEESKPEWLERLEEKERVAKEEEELSKLTTEQRAARERQQERAKLLEHAQKRQQEAKAKRAQLLKSRQESVKRKAEGGGGDKKRTRRLRWKDGLNNSDSLRQRNLLEVVHVYPKESAWEVEEEEGDGRSHSPTMSNEEFAHLEHEPEDDEIPYAEADD